MSQLPGYGQDTEGFHLYRTRSTRQATTRDPPIPSHLDPQRKHLIQRICSIRATSFVILIVLNIFVLFFSVFGQVKVAKMIGQSGLDKMKMAWVVALCLVVSLLSSISGRFIYIQVPFLIFANVISGMVFSFWLACVISIVINFAVLCSIYFLAKYRYSTAFEEEVNEADPVARFLDHNFGYSSFSCIWLLVGSISMIPNQIMMLIVAVTHWETGQYIIPLFFSVASSLFATYNGHCISHAIREESSSPIRSPLYGLIIQATVTVIYVFCLIYAYWHFDHHNPLSNMHMATPRTSTASTTVGTPGRLSTSSASGLANVLVPMSHSDNV